MSINLHDFESESFDSVSWINSFFGNHSLKLEQLNHQSSIDEVSECDSILSSASNTKNKTVQSAKTEEKPVIDKAEELSFIENSISELTKKLYLIVSEEQSNQDRIRIRLEKTVTYLYRDLDRFRISLKGAESNIQKIEPNLSVVDAETKATLLKVAKIQLIRHRLYETQSALEKLEILFTLPATIAKLKAAGKLIMAYDKLEEAIRSIAQLSLLSNMNFDFDKTIELLLLENSIKHSPSNEIKTRDLLNNLDSKTVLSNLLEKYQYLQQDLLTEGKEKLDFALIERNYEDCKIWIKFFQYSGDPGLPRHAYIQKTGSMLTKTWNSSYNENLPSNPGRNESSGTSITAPHIQLKTLKMLLLAFFDNLKKLLRDEMEFCDSIGIINHQNLIQELLEVICKQIGSSISENLLVLSSKSFGDVNQVLEQFIDMYRVVIDFVQSISQQFDDSLALGGVGETTDTLSQTSTLKSDLNIAFAYLLDPFIAVQSSYTNCEKLYLNAQLEKNILLWIQPQENNKSSTLLKEDTRQNQAESSIIRKIGFAQKQLKNLMESIPRSFFVDLERSRARSFLLTHGLSAFEYMGIFDNYLKNMLKAYFNKVLAVFTQSFILTPTSIKEWTQGQAQTVPTTEDAGFVSESALWWAQVELILTSTGVLLVILEKVLHFVTSNIIDLKKSLHQIYEFDQANNQLTLKEQIPEVYKPIASSPINSRVLVEMIIKVNTILNPLDPVDTVQDSHINDQESIEKDLLFNSFIPYSNNSYVIDGKLLTTLQTSDLLCLLMPETVHFAVTQVFSKLQKALLAMLIGSQLGALRKIPALDLWHQDLSQENAKSLNHALSNSQAKGQNASHKLDTNYTPGKSLRIPQFSFSPSSNIRVVGEQVLLLPMILEQIESKNVAEVDPFDLYQKKKNSEERNFSRKIALTGKHIISLPLAFVRIGTQSDDLRSILNKMVDPYKSRDTTATRNWLCAISETTLKTFVYYFSKIPKPLSEKGRGQIKADTDYLQSIFLAMDIHLDDEFAQMQLD